MLSITLVRESLFTLVNFTTRVMLVLFTILVQLYLYIYKKTKWKISSTTMYTWNKVYFSFIKLLMTIFLNFISSFWFCLLHFYFNVFPSNFFFQVSVCLEKDYILISLNIFLHVSIYYYEKYFVPKSCYFFNYEHWGENFIFWLEKYHFVIFFWRL